MTVTGKVLSLLNLIKNRSPQEEDDEIEHSQMIKTYKDANAYLEELHIFFEEEGHIEEAQ